MKRGSEQDWRSTMTALTTRLRDPRLVVPACAEHAVVAAEAVWLENHPEPLEPHRVELWDCVQRKNGNSTTIADAEDRYIRALMTVLWNDPWRVDWDSPEESCDWFRQMLPELSW